MGIMTMMVSDVEAESVGLNWDAPTTNADGTSLTDLAGYKIYYGTSTGVYDTTIDVGNTLCAVVSSLTVGLTYYFAATAYDVANNESDFSNEVSKLIASGNEGNCASNTSGMHFNWKHRSDKVNGGFGGGFQ